MAKQSGPSGQVGPSPSEDGRGTSAEIWPHQKLPGAASTSRRLW